MGIFDFLKLKPEKKINEILVSKSEYLNSYLQLKQETERLKVENDAWLKEFNIIISLREETTNLEKNGESNKAIEVYLRSIEFGEKSSHLNISNFAYDIERVIILYGKTKQKEKQKLFLERIINKYNDYPDINKWTIRLTKLKQDTLPKIKLSILPSDIKIPVAGNPTMGKILQDYKDSMPEFHFYYDMPEGMQTFQYLVLKKPVPFKKSVELRTHKDKIETLLNRAKLAENENDLKTAIEIYEMLVVEEYEGKEPYERLMIIYQKLKWQEQLKKILNKAISFFEQVRERQKFKTIKLARKYGMENKAHEYIDASKKIQYYGGAFDLYNPYPIISKWKESLGKME